MLVAIVVSSLVALFVSLLFSMACWTEIEKLKQEIRIMRAIIDHK